MASNLPKLHVAARTSLFSLPLEIRNQIYENLLISPIPLPPTPPQSQQYIYTAILRTNRRVYVEAIDFLYERNFFAIHLRSNLDKYAYNPLLSNLAADNAAKIRELEIVLWGSYNENNGDIVSFGTENFGIALKNLVYAPKFVICIDIESHDEERDMEPGRGTNIFCAFDWLMATFTVKAFYNKTYFDLFRAVARFHMKHMFPDSHVQMCQSRWFSESRATLGIRQHEQRRMWELEDRYGLAHEENEDSLHDSENDDGGIREDERGLEIEQNDNGTESDRDDKSEEEGQEGESSGDNGVDDGSAASSVESGIQSQ
jgi:hypothetical protein